MRESIFTLSCLDPDLDLDIWVQTRINATTGATVYVMSLSSSLDCPIAGARAGPDDGPVGDRAARRLHAQAPV